MVSPVYWRLSSMALQVSLTLSFLAWLVDVLEVQGLGGGEGLGLIGLMLRSLVRMKKGGRLGGRGRGGGMWYTIHSSLPLSLPLLSFSFIFIPLELGLFIDWCVDTLCLFPVYASLWMDLAFHHVIHISYWFDVRSCYSMIWSAG